MLATISEVLQKVIQPIRKVDLRKSKFSILPLFLFLPNQYLFHHTSTVISIKILCNSEISNKNLFSIAIYDLFLILEVDLIRYSNKLRKHLNVLS